MTIDRLLDASRRLALRLYGIIPTGLLESRQARFEEAAAHAGTQDHGSPYSQREVAQLAAERYVAGLQQSNLNAWLKKKRALSPEAITGLCELISISPRWLVDADVLYAPDRIFEVSETASDAARWMSGVRSASSLSELRLQEYLVAGRTVDEYIEYIDSAFPGIGEPLRPEMQRIVENAQRQANVLLSYDERMALMIALAAWAERDSSVSSSFLVELGTKLGVAWPEPHLTGSASIDHVSKTIVKTLTRPTSEPKVITLDDLANKAVKRPRKRNAKKRKKRR